MFSFGIHGGSVGFRAVSPYGHGDYGYDGQVVHRGGFSFSSGYGWGVSARHYLSDLPPAFNNRFYRNPYVRGQWGWGRRPAGAGNPVARGAAGVGRLAAGFIEPEKVPYVMDAMNPPRPSRYKKADKKDDDKKKKKADEKPELPKDDIAERAGTYFEEFVEKDDYADSSDVKDHFKGLRDVMKAEKKEERRDPDVGGREDSLIHLVGRIQEWARKKDAAKWRGEFLAMKDLWASRGRITTDQKLLALIAPGVSKKGNIPRNLAGDLRLPKGVSAADIGERFDVYRDMLRGQLGDDYDDIIDRLFDKAVRYAEDQTNKRIDAVSVSDIQTKGFEKDEAEAIYKHVFKGKAPIEQKKLMKKGFPDVDKKGEEKRASEIAGWYLQVIKGISDTDKLNEKYKKALEAIAKSERKPITLTFKGGGSDGTYFSKYDNKNWKPTKKPEHKFKMVLKGKKGKVYKKKGSSWVRHTRTIKKPSYNISDLLGELSKVKKAK